MIDFSPIFWITALVLVVAYIALEIYHGFSKRSGTVVRLVNSGIPLVGMVGCEVEVELDTGRQVRATASGCVLCQNPIRPGMRVFLVRHKDGWLVSNSEKRGGCARA